MAQNKNPSNEFMSIIIKRVRRNLEDSGNVTFKHVLRIHNQQADHYANQAVEKNEENVCENHDEYYNYVP